MPVATYRVQLNRSLTFEQARGIVPYLERLGIGDLYASPILAARSGSSHGYDVIDHGRVNPELGTETDLYDLARALRERGMGLVLDIVPNHMCIGGGGNAWWEEVLENGPSSAYARYFDIDWAPPKPDLVDKVLVPVLGDPYGHVLERGLASVRREGGAFRLSVPGADLPLAPKSWPRILAPAVERLRWSAGNSDVAVLELESILTAIRHLPDRSETDPHRVREREREKEIIKQRLHAVLEAAPAARTAVDDALAAMNGCPGDARSFDALEALLDDQAYRLSFWRVATDEINYRRFFDVNDLAAIRIEVPEVFQAVHGIAFRLFDEGLATGLRIDHVDGLLEPAAYLAALDRELAGRLAPGAQRFVVVEKILMAEERLPDDWPVEGTTGYEARAQLDGVFVHPDGVARIERFYTAHTGAARSFADQRYESKKLVLRASLSSELTVLARRLDRVSEQNRYSRDFTLNGLQHALAEVIACFPVYRTYVARGDVQVGEADRRHVEQAVDEARRRNPATSASVFDFIRSLLLLEHPEGLEPSQIAERVELALRFQQLAAPVTAKGVEDTAFYRWFPLASEAEVGGHPDQAAVPLGRFHAANLERLARWPRSLVATTTHDTKRGEEVRARIRVLSEIPDEWTLAVLRWHGWNRAHRGRAGSLEMPSPNDEYLLYQTLLGSWPFHAGPDGAVERPYRERIQRYLEKAMREAKVHTSWISPNDRYEGATRRFVDAILTPDRANRFLPDFLRLESRIRRPGLWASLCLVLLKVTVPGVPDFYQGTEIWNDHLVDPDNRRPVDFGRLANLLEGLDARIDGDAAGLADELARQPEDSRLKLLVTAAALRTRRARAELFRTGRYHPLEVRGPLADHVVAFARSRVGESCVVAVGRHFLKLMPVGDPPVGTAWENTELFLPEGTGLRFRDALTRAPVEARSSARRPRLSLSQVFARLPLALLEEQ